MSYNRPGVYINETSIATEVTNFGTASAAGGCLGAFEKGPDTLTLVGSWYDFVNTFGGYNASYPATFGVAQFFANGGSELYVKRVLGSGALVAYGNVAGRVSGNSTRFASRSKGADANLLRVEIKPAVEKAATITGASVSGSSGAQTITYTAANAFVAGEFVSVTGVIDSAAGTNYIVTNATITEATSTTFKVAVTGFAATYTSGGTAIAVNGYYNLAIGREVGTAESPDNFTDNVILETFNNLTFTNANSSDYVGTVLGLKSRYVVVDESSGTFNRSNPATVNPVILSGGADGAMPTNSAYVAALPSDGTSEFDLLNRPIVMFAPEAYAALALCDTDDKANLKNVQAQMTTWAAQSLGYSVFDIPPAITVANALLHSASAGVASGKAAAYYPYYYVADTVAQSSNALRLVGPSSGVVGLFLSTDRVAGPFKSPAGITAQLKGAIALERNLTSSDLDALNSGLSGTTNGYPINAIRNIPGAGIVVMGARNLTKATDTNRYIGPRRSLIYITKQMESISQFALFENNNETLWARLTTTLSVFLNDYRNQGGLKGTTPEEAYYIKCDSENNTAASIANGLVNIEIGVSLERPAEFVVINLSQMTAN
jgi:phage tail sheath protein FI